MRFTLRKLDSILQRSGTEYPKELPPLIELNTKDQTKEWLSAHNYDKKVATKIYDHHKRSMEGNNEKKLNNPEQLHILQTLETAIDDYHNKDNYNGLCVMLDAPGGTGKTFLIETIAAHCAMNDYLCLCSAFS